jgi:uncharacterized membrane protein YhaH (DUF805 family)
MHWYLLGLSRYFAYRGRATRQEYWWFTLFYGLTIALTVFADVLLGTFNAALSLGALSGCYVVATFSPMLAVTVRRLHDVGRSGWWCLLELVPGFGSVILLVICIFDSQPGSNAYGPSAKDLQAQGASDRKTHWVRKLSVGLAVSAAVLALVVGGARLWWSQNRDEILAQGKVRQLAGQDAGLHTDEMGCVRRSIQLHQDDGEKSMLTTTGIVIDLHACLDASRRTLDFCTDVPASTDMLATAQWIAGTCATLGMGNDVQCNSLIQVIPGYCGSPERAVKSATRQSL